MKIVAYGQGSAGAGVAARRWRAGREVTGRGRVGDDRGSREGSPAGRWWTLAAVCLGTFMLLLDISAVYVALPSIQAAAVSARLGSGITRKDSHCQSAARGGLPFTQFGH